MASSLKISPNGGMYVTPLRTDPLRIRIWKY